MARYPGWWQEGMTVSGERGDGTVSRNDRGGWIVRMDPGPSATMGFGFVGDVIVDPQPEDWVPRVTATLTEAQALHIAYDAERAVLLAHGCHYVPEWRALPESTRTATDRPRPVAVGRPELAAVQALVRGAVVDALRGLVR